MPLIYKNIYINQGFKENLDRLIHKYLVLILNAETFELNDSF